MTHRLASAALVAIAAAALVLYVLFALGHPLVVVLLILVAVLVGAALPENGMTLAEALRELADRIRTNRV